MVTCTVETEKGTDTFESEGLSVFTSAETALVSITDEHDYILDVYDVEDVLEIRLSYLEA